MGSWCCSTTTKAWEEREWEEKGKERGEKVYGFGAIAQKMFKFLGLAHL